MINYPSNASSSCNNKTGCSTTSYCPDFQIKRFDTKPSFKVSLVDCKGPLNLHGLIAEANMWAEAKLNIALTAGTQATGTVTIVEEANLVATTHYITITTTDGTVITATVTANGGTTTTTNTNSPTWAIVSGSNSSTATNLATCLNANSKLIATASSGVVTITQLASGTVGNTTIVLTDPDGVGMSKTDFTGGVDPSLSLSLADNIGFEQVMVGDVIIMERARRPEHMLVKAFDETNSLISVQRAYNDTEAFAWKKGAKLKIFRVLNSPADVELVFEDVIQVDGNSKSTLVEADVLYDWKANDTCLSGCYLFEFKLIKMQEILYFLQGGNWVGDAHQVSGMYYTGSTATDSSVPLSYDPETGTFLIPSTQWTGNTHVATAECCGDTDVTLSTTGVITSGQTSLVADCTYAFSFTAGEITSIAGVAISGAATSYSASFSEGSIDIVAASGPTTNTYNVLTACIVNRTGTSENGGSVALNTTGVESDNSVVYGQAFTDSSFASTDFGCGLSDGVEWVRSYPKNKEGFFVEITSSPISENY